MLNATITEQPRQCEPGYLLGTMVINHVYHHIECIRVEYNDNTGCLDAWPAPEGEENYNDSRLEGLYRLVEGSLAATTIPGHDGEWIVYITPCSGT